MDKEKPKQDEVKEILDDVESVFKKLLHKISDKLVGEGRKKLEKVCSDKNTIIHYHHKEEELGRKDE